MKTLLAILALALAASAQSVNENIVTLIPATSPSTGAPTTPGMLRFRDIQVPAHFVGIAGPASIPQIGVASATSASPMVLTLSSAAPAWVQPGASITLSGALGAGCSGMNAAQSVTAAAGTSVTIAFNGAACTYTASSASMLTYFIWIWPGSDAVGPVCSDGNQNLTINPSCPGGGGGGSGLPVVDTTIITVNATDATKKMRFNDAGISTASTRVLSVQDASYTLAGINLAETWTADQTFAANILAGAGAWNIGSATVPFAETFSQYIFVQGGFEAYKFGIDGFGNLTLISEPIPTLLWTQGIGGPLTESQNVLPSVTNTFSLGGPSLYWDNLYATNIDTGILGSVQCVNASALGVLSGSGAPCGGIGSIATTGPITGGPITSTGTIACPTCLTTSGGQTVTGTDTFSAIQIFNANVEFDFGLVLKASLGWDNTNGALAITAPVIGTLFEFDAAGQNVSYYDVVPSVTNTRNLGGPSLYWDNLYVTNIVTASALLPLNITGAGGVIVTGDVASLQGLSGPSIADTGILGSVQCVNASALGVLSGAGAPCGTVSSIATTSPITGGTITSTGTIACPTCLTTSGGQTVTGTDTFSGTLVVSGLLNVPGFTESLIPQSSSVYSLGSSGEVWNELYLNELFACASSCANAGAVTVIGNIVPQLNDTYNLGASGLAWNALIVVDIAADQLLSTSIANTGDFTTGDVASSLIPQTTNTYALGSGTEFWSGVFTQALRLGASSGCLQAASGTVSVLSANCGTGTVTSVATTSPITGGTITGSGTIACPTCAITPGAWTSWSPTITNLTSVSTNSAYYTTNGTMTSFAFEIGGTTNGNSPEISLPAATTSTLGQTASCTISFASAANVVSSATMLFSTVFISTYNGVAFPTGITALITCSGTYWN